MPVSLLFARILRVRRAGPKLGRMPVVYHPSPPPFFCCSVVVFRSFSVWVQSRSSGVWPEPFRIPVKTILSQINCFVKTYTEKNLKPSLKEGFIVFVLKQKQNFFVFYYTIIGYLPAMPCELQSANLRSRLPR